MPRLRPIVIPTLVALAAAAPASAAARHVSAHLLVNGAGRAGAVSVQGWDSVTIPGWQVRAGLPTVVGHGTARFASNRAFRGRLFAGGPGGTALLRQRVSLRSPSLRRGARYRLSGWLGGTATSAASVTATFLSARGTTLAHAIIGPVGRTRKPALARRTVSGTIPHNAVAARIVVRLVTSLRNFDGPNAPITGYNRAVAGGLRFTVGAPVKAPPRLTPPAAHIPRFDHVFMFMFENQGLRAVIGNRRQAPYLNSLLPHASLLSNLFAEEHPSDGNYLALSAGGVFGIPLTDPLEINPRFTVRARQIGDLIDAAHEKWKAYLENAAGPCDDTVHGYYWNDDLPFLYFPQVRDRPAYCAAHDVPLEEMQADLASTATTPNFAWVGADDCDDMEGCGIRAGDRFLARTLGSILVSPAWRTQRSLAIITFDEDAYDHEHPPQLVPTIVLGSTGVRAGFVSHVRYTHYSLLRTIEAALGLPTLTKNDRYAQPLNDVFGGRPRARLAAWRPYLTHSAPRRRRPARRNPRTGATAFVANSASASVTPISLTTAKAGSAIRVGSHPAAIATTPNGRTAYVVDSGSNAVTPIDAHTRKAGKPIPVGSDPRAIAITPDGRTAYVVNSGSDSVTPIDTATNHPGAPIAVGSDPRSIALTPDGRTAYVLDWGGAAVTPIDVASQRARAPIPVGSYPSAIAIAPGGATAYVASYAASTVTPIDSADAQPGRPIRVGQAPNALAITPDGARIEVVSGDRDSVTPIDTATRRAGAAIPVGYSPSAVLIPTDKTAWVANTISGNVTPVDVRRGRAGRPVSVGAYSYPTAISRVPGTTTALVVGTYGGKVALLNTRTGRVRARIKVGSYPVAVAVSR